MFFRKILFFFVFLPVGVCVAQTPDSTEREPLPNELIYYEKIAEALNLDSVKKLIIFPEKLKKQTTIGKVVVRILVDKNGTPLKHVIQISTHRLFTKEIERVIYLLRFTPAMNNNKAVKSWAIVVFNFKLK